MSTQGKEIGLNQVADLVTAGSPVGQFFPLDQRPAHALLHGDQGLQLFGNVFHATPQDVAHLGAWAATALRPVHDGGDFMQTESEALGQANEAQMSQCDCAKSAIAVGGALRRLQQTYSAVVPNDVVRLACHQSQLADRIRRAGGHCCCPRSMHCWSVFAHGLLP